MSKPEIEPRIRGKVFQMPNGRWSWKAFFTAEKDRVVSELPLIDAQLIEQGESIEISAPCSFSTREKALRNLHKHGQNMKRIIEEAFNDKSARKI